MADRVFSVRLKVRNEIARKDFEETISSTAGFQLQSPDDPASCDLLILETGNDAEQDLDSIQTLQASEGAKEVFLTSPHFESDLLLQAFRAGVKEFLSQPIKGEEVRKGLLK